LESAEDHIKKQALLEVMMGSQIWNEPYVSHNPFLYITTRTQDFEGSQGTQLHSQFKRIFMQAYQKYQNVANKVVPQEVFLNRSQIV
jgi:hypothetical protein